MEKRRRTGTPVQEFTQGKARATVWANKPSNGELFLKVSLGRVVQLPDGGREFQFSFYPEDLADVVDVIVHTAEWLSSTAAFLLPARTDGAPPAKGMEPKK